MARRLFFIISPLLLGLVMLLAQHSVVWWYALLLVVPIILLGIYDLNSSSNVLRNYPVIGHIRYMFEFIRPEIQQYLVNTNQSGRPFNREVRSIVYQRAKGVIDTLPFGTQQDITKSGYEFILHSMHPQTFAPNQERILVGAGRCAKSYSASRLNISGMSFGAISPNAILALNWGAKIGQFAQNTGEGGISPYHLEHGGDLIWQIGTGYFGCRNQDGGFDRELFAEQARHEAVKMIEIKLSQGAKPAHGGILPGVKVDAEIAASRKIPVGVDCHSPAAHSAFTNPLTMIAFIDELRELSGGKPVGIKLCIGKHADFFAICKAMQSSGSGPDFITIDGAEGGTGAAPLEFSNRLGLPINEALNFAHKTLLACDLRQDVKLFASGKVATGFDLLTKLALGADVCLTARAMMFSIGCIQALKCNTNDCPTGITTMDKTRGEAVVVKEKYQRVARYHDATLTSCFELIGAMGYSEITQLSADDVYLRTRSDTAVTYSQLFTGDVLKHFAPAWEKADASVF